MIGRMKTVKISRKRWCRGGRSETPAALRTSTGQSCCLGFVARAYGLSTPVGDGTFSTLADGGQDCSVLPKLLQPKKQDSGPLAGKYGDTDLHDDLTCTNDDSGLDAVQREKQIKKFLAKAGIKAVFVD